LEAAHPLKPTLNKAIIVVNTAVPCKLRACAAAHLVRCARSPLAVLCALDKLRRLFTVLSHFANDHHVVSGGSLAEFYFLLRPVVMFLLSRRKYSISLLTIFMNIKL
jgi:hypothetical protein